MRCHSFATSLVPVATNYLSTPSIPPLLPLKAVRHEGEPTERDTDKVNRVLALLLNRRDLAHWIAPGKPHRAAPPVASHTHRFPLARERKQSAVPVPIYTPDDDDDGRHSVGSVYLGSLFDMVSDWQNFRSVVRGILSCAVRLSSFPVVVDETSRTRELLPPVGQVETWSSWSGYLSLNKVN